MSDVLVEVPSSRLGRTNTFRNNAYERWSEAELHIVGAGTLGQRLAMEAVLSGASVVLYDFDCFTAENAGTQFGAIGMRKVDSCVARAATIRSGRARGVPENILHVGIGVLRSASVIIDCTDDPSLALPLTQISNGLCVPLLRAALDGSGEHERGRIACSHGGSGCACQVCTYEMRSLMRHLNRTPCPGNPLRPSQPTLAGGAIATTIAGITLLQAQRLVTGNDLGLVLNREWIIDLDTGAMWPLGRQRSEECLSGHVRWTLTSLDRKASETTLVDLFHEASNRLDDNDVTLEPYGHPLCCEALCPCGGHAEALGTPWCPAIPCSDCGQRMHWSRATALSRFTLADAQRLRISDRPLTDLGLPEVGPLFVARVPRRPPLRILLS